MKGDLLAKWISRTDRPTFIIEQKSKAMRRAIRFLSFFLNYFISEYIL